MVERTYKLSTFLRYSVLKIFCGFEIARIMSIIGKKRIHKYINVEEFYFQSSIVKEREFIWDFNGLKYNRTEKKKVMESYEVYAPPCCLSSSAFLFINNEVEYMPIRSFLETEDELFR